MIEKMLKLTIVAKKFEQDRFVAELGRLGVLHLIPLDDAITDETKNVAEQIETVSNALEFIKDVEPIATKLELSTEEILQEICLLREQFQACKKNIESLTEQLKQQALWGNVSLEVVHDFRNSELPLRFFLIPSDEVCEFKADATFDCGEARTGLNLWVVVNIQDEISQKIEEVFPPQKSNVVLQNELMASKTLLKQLDGNMVTLAAGRNQLIQFKQNLGRHLLLNKALDGTYAKDELFALQAWVPKRQQQALELALANESCCFQFEEPLEGEEPPTLISYPCFIKPIQGLFDILNVLPGYRESDVSAFFMLFLPIFVAIIIGDAGYGLSIFLLGGVFYKKIAKIAGSAKASLVCVLGGVTSLYGILFGSYFGYSPADLGKLITLDAGASAVLSSLFLMIIAKLAIFWNPDTEHFKILLMMISFVLGGSHLVFAHLIQFVKYFPSQQAWSEIGWATFIFGMFGVIWGLFLNPEVYPFIIGSNSILVCLALGAFLSICFSCPNRSWFSTRIPVGFVSCLLSWIGAFSDLVSYVRLMAVALSGFYIAATVNGLAQNAFDGLGHGVIGGIAFAVIFVMGHGFNVILALIAVLAHGVRLNMLEFSNNAGVQWSGVGYSPFVLLKSKGE